MAVPLRGGHVLMFKVDLTRFTRIPIGDLIIAYAEVTELRVHAMEEECQARVLYDRTFTNAYANSAQSSHAAKAQEAEFEARIHKEELVELTHQVAVHTLVANFIGNIIEWRQNEQGPSRLQGGSGPDREARRDQQGSGGRDSRGLEPTRVQGGEEAEPALESS